MKKIKKILEAMPWSYRLLIILGLLFISVILTSYSMYKEKQQKIDEYVKDVPKFELRLANVQFLRTSDEKNYFICIEMEITNLGSPSVAIEWRAELKLDSQTIKTALPITIIEDRKFLSKDHIIAKFSPENSLMEKATEEPLAKGARKVGWLIFEFINITGDQLINAEKIVYVKDYLKHEYSYKLEAINEMPSLITDIHSYIPGAGPPPFK